MTQVALALGYRYTFSAQFSVSVSQSCATPRARTVAEFFSSFGRASSRRCRSTLGGTPADSLLPLRPVLVRLQDFHLSAGATTHTCALHAPQMPNNLWAKRQTALRGTQYRRYSPLVLQGAVTAVREQNVSLVDAAAAHGVPYHTLRRHVLCNVGRNGPRPILTACEEADIEHYLLQMSDMGLGLDKASVNKHVLEIVDDGRAHPWKKANTTGPGRDWWSGFMLRHPKLSFRKSQELERPRAIMSNVFVLRDFFDKLKMALDNVRPALVFNCDETKVDGQPPRVIARKGQRAVNALADPMMEHITIVACGNATGTHIMAPALISQAVNLQEHWYDPEQKDLLWATSQSGWMESGMFASWMDHFIEFVNDKRAVIDGVKEPVLLIFDGHKTHVTLQAIQKAERAGVRLLKLPAHTTHLVQPLDLSCFGPWHRHWGRRLLEFRVKRPQTAVSKQIFAALFREPWNMAMSKQNLVAGFKAAGIHPYNPAVVLSRLSDKASPATALSAADPSSPADASAAQGWPKTPSPTSSPPSSSSSSPLSLTSSSASNHTPKFELLASLRDHSELLEQKQRRINELEQKLEELKTKQRRQEVLRFPFEEALKDPAAKRTRTFVNGSEFLTTESFTAKAEKMKEEKAKKLAEKEAEKQAKREKRAASKAEARTAKAAEMTARTVTKVPTATAMAPVRAVSVSAKHAPRTATTLQGHLATPGRGRKSHKV